jgi:predicted DNA-binding protein (MmcQ/YjbR family)
MTPEAFDAACRGLPACEHVVQWGGADVYKVGGRIFAILAGDRGASIKVSPIAFEVLVESGLARPAPYLARAGWVRFDDLAKVDGEEMAGSAAQAHALVAQKLPRARRRELGLF